MIDIQLKNQFDSEVACETLSSRMADSWTEAICASVSGGTMYQFVNHTLMTDMVRLVESFDKDDIGSDKDLTSEIMLNSFKKLSVKLENRIEIDCSLLESKIENSTEDHVGLISKIKAAWALIIKVIKNTWSKIKSSMKVGDPETDKTIKDVSDSYQNIIKEVESVGHEISKSSSEMDKLSSKIIIHMKRMLNHSQSLVMDLFVLFVRFCRNLRLSDAKKLLENVITDPWKKLFSSYKSILKKSLSPINDISIMVTDPADYFAKKLHASNKRGATEATISTSYTTTYNDNDSSLLKSIKKIHNIILAFTRSMSSILIFIVVVVSTATAIVLSIPGDIDSIMAGSVANILVGEGWVDMIKGFNFGSTFNNSVASFQLLLAGCLFVARDKVNASLTRKIEENKRIIDSKITVTVKTTKQTGVQPKNSSGGRRNRNANESFDLFETVTSPISDYDDNVNDVHLSSLKDRFVNETSDLWVLMALDPENRNKYQTALNDLYSQENITDGNLGKEIYLEAMSKFVGDTIDYIKQDIVITESSEETWLDKIKSFFGNISSIFESAYEKIRNFNYDDSDIKRKMGNIDAKINEIKKTILDLSGKLSNMVRKSDSAIEASETLVADTEHSSKLKDLTKQAEKNHGIESDSIEMVYVIQNALADISNDTIQSRFDAEQTADFVKKAKEDTVNVKNLSKAERDDIVSRYRTVISKHTSRSTLSYMQISELKAICKQDGHSEMKEVLTALVVLSTTTLVLVSYLYLLFAISPLFLAISPLLSAAGWIIADNKTGIVTWFGDKLIDGYNFVTKGFADLWKKLTHIGSKPNEKLDQSIVIEERSNDAKKLNSELKKAISSN